MYKNIRIVLALMILSCIQLSAQAQQPNHVNPWIKELGTLPPIASLTDGVWLKGDLHVHSRHSTDADRSDNNSVAKIIAFAQSVGMGFLGITDHDNHVLGDVAHNTWTDPEFKSDSLLLLYGAEWTTPRGHGNTFSAKPYDHQKFYDVRDQRDANIIAVKKELGIHVSANHPAGPKDHFGFSYDLVDAMEIWNSALWSKNANAILIWEDMLESGRRMPVRGGSDSHRYSKQNYIGTPTTWVFAANRTSQAVVYALTNGRVSVSANPYAPRVEFYADLDQDGKMDAMMGDNVKSTGKPVKFRIQLTGNVIPDSTYTVRVVKNNRNLGAYKLSGKTPFVEFTDSPVLINRSFYFALVEGPSTDYPQVPGSMKVTGNMVGLSNPIYFNFDPKF